MDEYITLELPSFENRGVIDDDDPFLQYLLKQHTQLRDWNITDPLREGAASIIRGFNTSNMEHERLQSLVGLSDEQFVDAVRNRRVSREEWPLGKMHQQQRDDLLRGRLAQLDMWQHGINEVSDFLSPTPHAEPDTWYGKAGYKVLETLPGLAKDITGYTLGGPIYALLNSGMQTHNTQENVYNYLRQNGHSPDDARVSASNLPDNLMDLGVRSATSLAVLGALGKQFPYYSFNTTPLQHILRQSGKAALYAGAGATAEQALTNSRMGIDNNFADLAQTGAIAGGLTGLVGLMSGALNYNNYKKAQENFLDFWAREVGLDADVRDVTPNDGHMGLGSENTPPNDPTQSPLYNMDITSEPPGGLARSLPQGTLQLPEYGTSNASLSRRFNNAVTERGFTPLSNEFQPNAIARQIATYIANGAITHKDALDMLQKGGLTKEQAQGFIDTGIAENLQRSPKQSQPTKQPTEIIIDRIANYPNTNMYRRAYGDPLDEVYSDFGGDNSAPLQDIPDNSIPDNSPAINSTRTKTEIPPLTVLGADLSVQPPSTENTKLSLPNPVVHSDTFSLAMPKTNKDISELEEILTPKPRDTRDLFPALGEKRDDLTPDEITEIDSLRAHNPLLATYLESKPSDLELAHSGFKYGENGEYVPIKQEEHATTQDTPKLTVLGEHSPKTKFEPQKPITGATQDHTQIEVRDDIQKSTAPKNETSNKRIIPEGAKLKSGKFHVQGYGNFTVKPNEFLERLDIAGDSNNGSFNLFEYLPEINTFHSRVVKFIPEVTVAEGAKTKIGLINDSKKEAIEKAFFEHINDFYEMPSSQENSTKQSTAPVPETSHLASPHIDIAERVKSHVLKAFQNENSQTIPLTNNELLEWSSQAFGGTKGEGKFNPKDAYDAMEMGINSAIQEAGFNPSQAKDITTAINDIFNLNRILQSIPTQANRTDEQIKYQQFSTPPTLAYLVNWLANIHRGANVLEPSAGTGNLAVFAKNAGANLTLNDYSETGLRADILDALNWGKVYREDALHLADILTPKLGKDNLPDRIIMNPPFSAAGKQGTKNSNQVGFAHVEQALKLLRPGGRLVTILGSGIDGKGTSTNNWLKHIAKKYNVRAVINSGGKAYKKYGTNYGNIIAVIDNTGATPKGETKQYSFDGDFSNYDNVHTLLSFLNDIRNDVKDNPVKNEVPNNPVTSSTEEWNSFWADEQADKNEKSEHGTSPKIQNEYPIKDENTTPMADDTQEQDNHEPEAQSKPKDTTSPTFEKGNVYGLDIEGLNKPLYFSVLDRDGDTLFVADNITKQMRSVEVWNLDGVENITWKYPPLKYRQNKTISPHDIPDEKSRQQFSPPSSYQETVLSSAVKEKLSNPAFANLFLNANKSARERMIFNVWDNFALQENIKTGKKDKASYIKALVDITEKRLNELDAGHEILDDEGNVLHTPLLDAKRKLLSGKNEGSKDTATTASVNSPSNSPRKTEQKETGENDTKNNTEGNTSEHTGIKLLSNISGNKSDTPKDNDTEDLSVYSAYKPSYSARGAKSHPADLVEATAMRAVSLPPLSYEPNIPDDVIKKGWLSDAQLEAVAYAGQAFSSINDDGQRRGFFIGDGTGVGKGREISGIILDALRHGFGKGKALWISEKHSLIQDAKRDWGGLGNSQDDIFAHEAVANKKPISRDKGILFSAYTFFAGTGSKDRIEQLKNWLGDDFDGVIALDECHNVNNVLRIGGKKPATRSINVRDFIKAFPKARVLYVSATGATEIQNLAMLDRLGLWGSSHSPFADATDFVTQVSKGGVAAMELVARDLKAMGLYLARSLSMRSGPHGGKENVTFRTLQHNLTDYQVDTYNLLSDAWQKILQNINEALIACGHKLKNEDGLGKARAKSIVESMFWGAHQRFFNQVITALQTPAAIKDIQKQLEAGHSVVVQLTNTFEAALDKALVQTQKTISEKKARGEDIDDFSLDELDLSPKATVIDFLKSAFPVQKVEAVQDEDGAIQYIPVTDSNGKPVLSAEAVRKRDNMISMIEGIKQFPESPIDMILNYFGHENVAEITGRTKRPRKGYSEPEKRTKKKRLAEIEDFNSGRKRILIFSEAGGTGASYHASNDFENKQKRIHYLLQPGWRADKAIQGLGRTHRSNEAHKPEYVLVTTDIPGQKRFISTIARRLEQLGALTSGERKATSGGLFADDDNLEAPYIKTSVNRLFYELFREDNPYPELDPDTVIQQLGFSKEELQGSEVQSPKALEVTRFLNRILSMSVEGQKALFNRFMQVVNATKEYLTANNKLDARTENINAKSINVLQENNIYHSKEFGTDTQYLEVELTLPTQILPFEALPENSQFFQLDSGKVVAAVVADLKGHDINTGEFFTQYKVFQPDKRKVEWGVRETVLHNKSAKQRRHFTKIDRKKALSLWREQATQLPETYTERKHIITGAIIPIWKQLNDDHPQLKRVITQDGREFLGREIPDNSLQQTLARLNLRYSSRKSYSAEQLRAELDKQGMTASLFNGYRIKFSRVNGERRLEVFNFDVFQEASLVKSGLLREYIGSKPRLFFPNGNDDILQHLLDDYPVVNISESRDADDILDETAGIINSSIPNSDNLYFVHPSFHWFGADNASADENPYVQTSPYAFSNPETEKRYQASKKAANRKTLLQHVRDFGAAIWKGRHDLPELADNDYLIEAQEQIRGLKRERQANVHEVENRLRAITLELTPDDFDLFQRAMQLQDLNETRELDPSARMTWGLNPEPNEYRDPVREEFSAIMQHVRKNPRVLDAMQKAEILINDLRDKLIEAADRLGMYDVRDKMKRKHYFRHLVMEYYNIERIGQPRPTFKNPERRGYLSHRQGSEKDISSNWILAMGEVFTRMTDDIKILNALHKLRTKYDIIEKLKQDAFSANKAHALDKIIHSLKDIPDELRKTQAEETLKQKLLGRQAHAIAKLFSLAKNGDLPVGDNNEWIQIAGRMADAGQLEALSKEEHQQLSRYIGWLTTLEDKSKARKYARKFLFGEKSKNSELKKILGDEYLDWQSLIPEDHTLWSPSDSRLVFSANSVPENILLLALENINEMLGVDISELGKVMTSGGNKQLWCIPQKLADTLNSLGSKQPTGLLKRIMQPLMSGFKQWVTIGPANGRVVKYNWRNFFGDFEAVLQGNPNALYYFHKATKELSDTMLKGGIENGLLSEFNKRGGGITTQFMTEFEKPEQVKEFAHLFEKNEHTPFYKWPLKAIKAYMDITSTLTNYRESILRYASFMSYVKLIQDNNGKPPFYGMSKPKEVDALRDNVYDMAFKLANENLGAYDQLSHNMQWLRDNYFMSFISWVEVNFTRSIQMYKNIWAGNSYLEFWIKKYGQNFIGNLNGYGGGNGGNNEPPHNGGKIDDSNDGDFRRIFSKAAKKSPLIALRLAITLLMAAPLWIALSIFNRLNSNNEDKLSPDVQRTPHLTLGTNPVNGEVMYLGNLGSAFDFFETIGCGTLTKDLQDLFNGRTSFGQILTNTLDGPISKFASNANPYVKTLLEAAFGKRMFPSALNPSPIRDKARFLSQSFGLEWYYDFLTDKPHKPFYDFSSSIVNTQRQEQSAYFYILSRRKQFEENVLGKHSDFFSQTKRGEALRNARQAADLGDRNSMRKFLREYYRAGGTDEGLKASASAINPLYGLNDDEETRFIRWLPAEERKILRRALRYSERLKAKIEP